MNEMAYTPDVFDARKVLDWGEEVGRAFEGDEKWKDVSMCGERLSSSPLNFTSLHIISLRDQSSHVTSISVACFPLPFNVE